MVTSKNTLSAKNLEALGAERLASYHVNQVPDSARWQIFLRDPNNVEIELNFEVANETS